MVVRATECEDLLRMGVLVVERDEATLRIVAELLRRCGYKVTTASDGLKAWELVKKNPQDIDLVLTEVDLPSISGFNLLSMVVDSEASRNIPVIMMSSNDSISLVFKCMLRGASDFLIKPIRKNELRTLWQHVWRKNNGNSGHYSSHSNEVQNSVMHHGVESTREEGVIPNDCASNKELDKELNCQHSDAQSSCTKSNLEPDNREKILDLNTVFKNSNIIQYNSKHLQLQSEEVTTLDTDVRGSALPDNCGIMDEDRENPSKMICISSNPTNQIQLCHFPEKRKMSQNFCSDTSEVLHESDYRRNSCSTSHVELTRNTRGCNNFNNKQNNETNVLNHSKTSAFSMYNSKRELPTLLETTQCKGRNLSSNSTFHDQGPSGAPKCDISRWHINPDDANAMDVETPTNKDEVSHSFSTVIDTAIPVPFGSTPSQRILSLSQPVSLPTCYQLPVHPLYNPVSSIRQEETTFPNTSKQHDHDNVKFHYRENSSAKTTLYGCTVDAKMPNSVCTEESVSNSICDGGAYTIACSSSSDVSKNVTDNGQDKLIKQTSEHFASQREIALNRFRLKRKDRCFKKKVRYENRKVLAENRPRMKGQFVRKK